MKNFLYKLAVYLLCFFLFTTIIYSKELDLDSDKYILYNLNDDSILLEKDSEDKTSIASITKLMTILVFIENIEDYDKKVKITKDMFKNVASDVATSGYKVGDTVTYNDLLYATFLLSGAEAANALALSAGKTYDNFIKMMNDKAKELGLSNTKFANPIGLYDKNNYSSASDVAKLLKYALNNKKFKKVFETKKYKATNGKIMKSFISSYGTNHNVNVDYINGGKTGYISKSGYCYASTSTINGINYLLVTLNNYNKKTSYFSDTIKIYKYFSENYSYKKIVDLDTKVVTLNTKYAKEKMIDLTANVEINKYIKNNTNLDKIEYKYEGINEISYFTLPGTYLGSVSIIYDDNVLDKFDLLYYGTLTLNLSEFLIETKVIYIIIFLVLIMLINPKSKKKKHFIKRRKH